MFDNDLATSTPCKRPRLELDEEEDEDDTLEGASSIVVEDPHDITYDPLHSVNLTESTDVP